MDKITKKNIESEAKKINIPDEGVMLQQLSLIKQKNPALFNKIVKKLKKKFPDKDWSWIE